MMEVTKINKWYNYDIRYEFKEIGNDIQLLIYLNGELAFATKKNSFKKKDIIEHKFKLNKFKLPYTEPFKKTVLLWESKKEQDRFRNFCKQFKYSTCVKLQEELMLKMSDYSKLTII